MVLSGWRRIVNEKGDVRVPIVFDNLIHQKAMPVTIGIYRPWDDGGGPAGRRSGRADNRSFEYDALGGRYAAFLTQEILPEVEEHYKLSTNPSDRGLADRAPGGIAAFTAAWERPDAFRRVASFVGSFTNLRGGDGYTDMIRKMEPKPLRVFLQDGTNDQSIYSGFLVSGEPGGGRVAGVRWIRFQVRSGNGGPQRQTRRGDFPEAMRWLWRDDTQPIRASKGLPNRRHSITEILDPDHDWELVGKGYKLTEGPAVDREGNVYFCDAGTSRIYKINGAGSVALFKENDGGVTGLMFGGDGRLYAAENTRKRVVAYGMDGKLTVLASGVEPNDLAVTSKGGVYFTDSPGQKVWYIDPSGTKRMVFDASANDSILLPNGVRLTPDEAMLAVADTVGRNGWSFRIAADGSLEDGQPFYHFELPDDVSNGPVRSGADGMTFDNTGHLYVATKLGVQICDQAGRVVGIIRVPGSHDLSNLVFGGPELDTLYATAGDSVYRRKLRRKGVFPWQPVKLPRPQL